MALFLVLGSEVGVKMESKGTTVVEDEQGNSRSQVLGDLSSFAGILRFLQCGRRRSTTGFRVGMICDSLGPNIHEGFKVAYLKVVPLGIR